MKYSQTGKNSKRHYLQCILQISVLAGNLCLCFSCKHIDSHTSINKEALKLAGQKKYPEAEALLQKETFELENHLRELKTESSASRTLDKLKIKNLTLETERLAASYFNLGRIFHNQGKYVQSEEAFERALDLHSSCQGKNNRFAMDCLNYLATAYFKQGKVLDAERYFKEELEVQQKLLKPGSLALAVTANNLAAIYQKLGDDYEAEKHFQLALATCRNCKSSEKEADQLADILNNLALFYEKQGSYPEARDMVEQAFDIENNHRGVLFIQDKVRSLLVLANIEKSTLDMDAAEQHYKEALELVNSKLGKSPELLSEASEKYAELLFQERKFKEAEPQFELAIKSCKEANGPEHPSVAERLSEFALLYRRTGRFKESEDLLGRALAIQEKTIGVDTPAFLSTVHRLATVFAEQNRYEQADKLYQEILPKLRERLGPMHPFVADTMDNWASYLDYTGNKLKAAELRKSAQTMRRNIARSLAPSYGPSPQ